MPARPVRRFMLLDAMVLLAATALGLAGMRASWPHLDLVKIWPGLRSGEKLTRFGVLYYLMNTPRQFLLPFLVSWTLALALLWSRMPRRRLRRLVLQPGPAACAAATVGIILTALGWLSRVIGVRLTSAYGRFYRHWPLDSWVEFHLRDLDVASAAIGVSVTTAWAILILGRRCRGDRGWLEWTSRAVGALWILMSLTHWFTQVLVEAMPAFPTVPAS
jgi:hypothetical protein